MINNTLIKSGILQDTINNANKKVVENINLYDVFSDFDWRYILFNIFIPILFLLIFYKLLKVTYEENKKNKENKNI